MNNKEKYIDDFLSMVGDRLEKEKGYGGAIFDMKLSDLLMEFYEYIKEQDV